MSVCVCVCVCVRAHSLGQDLGGAVLLIAQLAKVLTKCVVM